MAISTAFSALADEAGERGDDAHAAALKSRSRVARAFEYVRQGANAPLESPDGFSAFRTAWDAAYHDLDLAMSPKAGADPNFDASSIKSAFDTYCLDRLRTFFNELHAQRGKDYQELDDLSARLALARETHDLLNRHYHQCTLYSFPFPKEEVAKMKAFWKEALDQ